MQDRWGVAATHVLGVLAVGDAVAHALHNFRLHHDTTRLRRHISKWRVVGGLSFYNMLHDDHVYLFIGLLQRRELT